MSPSAILLFLFLVVAQAALMPYGEGFNRLSRAMNEEGQGYYDRRLDAIPMRNIRYYRTGGAILLG